MITKPCRLALTLAIALTTSAASDALAAQAEPGHTFVLTYRHFGPVKAMSVFQTADQYSVRFEGCFAKHSEEAVCGFTLRATTPLTLTNVANASHGSDATGGEIRSCCLFIQGDDRGYPLTASTVPAAGAAVLTRRLQPGETLGVMLRIPNYKQVAALKAVTFSSGQGDAGVQFACGVEELP